jgi:hypothetical protein
MEYTNALSKLDEEKQLIKWKLKQIPNDFSICEEDLEEMWN